MKSESIRALLEAYRPGENLESDPQMRAALDAAARDPQLAALRAKTEEFDAAFAARVRQIQPPADLRERILAAHAAGKAGSAKATPALPTASNPVPFRNWLHPAAFALAAVVVLSLALVFTFWQRPGVAQPAAMEMQAASAGPDTFIHMAAEVLQSHRPEFRSSQPRQMVQFISDRGGSSPQNMPGQLSWDQTVACDVVLINGQPVSIICFKSASGGMMHMVVFQRDAFDLPAPGPLPEMQTMDNGAFAAWSENNLVHVLYSESGSDNLRSALDI